MRAFRLRVKYHTIYDSQLRSRRYHATCSNPSNITKPEEIRCNGIQNIGIERFRQLMRLDKPFSMKDAGKRSHEFIPAIDWFENAQRIRKLKESFPPYAQFVYELMLPSLNDHKGWERVELFRQSMQHTTDSYLDFIPKQSQIPLQSGQSFHTFTAPFSLLFHASQTLADGKPYLPSLYMAQTQLIDLPPEVQKALPTPHLVLEADRGDVYDANLWLGTAPTYTPLHKDPNPNLFVQLTGRKIVRAFTPTIGRGIFDAVQREMRGAASNSIKGLVGNAAFRGEEMMQGSEREISDRRVWTDCDVEGYEVVVEAGDSLFIPQGWWHSIKSLSDGLNGSVNWWFR